MERDRSGIVARYPDGDHAGRAVERLSRHGVEAGRISLAGTTDRPLDRHTQRRRDAGTASRLAERFGKGLLAGAVAGALLGALVVVAVTGAGAGAALAGAVAGAGAGGGLGALLGLQATPTMSTAWSESFSTDESGGVVLAVQAGDEAALAEVEQALAGTEAVEIRRVADLDAAARDL